MLYENFDFISIPMNVTPITVITFHRVEVHFINEL